MYVRALAHFWVGSICTALRNYCWLSWCRDSVTERVRKKRLTRESFQTNFGHVQQQRLCLIWQAHHINILISYYRICSREIGELAKVWTYIAIQPKYLTIVYVRAHARAQLVSHFCNFWKQLKKQCQKGVQKSCILFQECTLNGPYSIELADLLHSCEFREDCNFCLLYWMLKCR